MVDRIQSIIRASVCGLKDYIPLQFNVYACIRSRSSHREAWIILVGNLLSHYLPKSMNPQVPKFNL